MTTLEVGIVGEVDKQTGQNWTEGFCMEGI